MRINGLIVLLAISFFSCEEIEDSCKESKTASALIYEFPDSLQVGETHNLSVHYIIENSCGSFDTFLDTTYNATTEVKVQVYYDGCNCNLEFQEDSSIYSIQHDTAGIFNYKFMIGDADFDTYMLTVY